MGHTARGKTRKPIRKPTRDRVLRSCPRRRSPDADGGTRRAGHGPGARETATATGASRRGRCLPCTVRKPPSPARTRQRDVPPRDLVWLRRPVLHFSFLPAFSRRMKTTHERGKNGKNDVSYDFPFAWSGSGRAVGSGWIGREVVLACCRLAAT